MQALNHRFYWLPLIFLVAFPVLAQSPGIALAPSQKVVSIAPGAGIFADPTGRLSINDAVNAGYQPLPADQKVSSSSRVYWVRLPLRPESGSTAEWILRVEPGWEQVDLYSPRSGAFGHLHSGDAVSPSERPVDSNLVLFPLTFHSTDEFTLYVRLEGDTSRYGSARTTRMSIVREDAFLSETRLINYAQGIYAGIILAMVSYNLILFFGVRELTYLYYSAYVASFGMVWMGRAGFTQEFLWPHAAGWDAASGFYLVAIAVFFSVLFVRSFLNTRTWSRSVDIVLWGLAGLTVSLAFAGLLGWSRIAAPLLAFDALLTSLFYGVIGIMMHWRGYRPARLFLTAWWVLIGTNVIYILTYLSVLPKNVFTYNSAQIGSGVECILLAFALADRVSTLKSERVREQERYTARLEEDVRQRTLELSELNAQLADASITDPLTGLKNRRFVDAAMEAFTAEIRRENYRGEPLEHLLICLADLDRFKQINDTYGHDFGDHMLKGVASTLARNVRGSTILARWGGEEFLLLDRVHPSDDDRRFAERLRSVIYEDSELRTPDGKTHMTVSLGLARFPMSETYPELLPWADVLALADQALYLSKNAGRDRWTYLCPQEANLAQFIQEFGMDAASDLCRNHLPEALERGILRVFTPIP